MPKRTVNAPTEGKNARVNRRKPSKADAACQDEQVQSATSQPPSLHISGADGTHCPSCGSSLAYYFLNFQEKVLLCCKKECLFPLDSETDIEQFLAPVEADAAARPIACVAAKHSVTVAAAKATERVPATRRENLSAPSRSLSRQSAAASKAVGAPAAADAHAVALAAPAMPSPAEAAATEAETLGQLLLPASPVASPRSHRADSKSDSSRFSSPFIFGGASPPMRGMPAFDLLGEADDMMLSTD
uniref:Uncharacterized protein n=1 Tax=Chrysotila carterae TaxID=13221 RepID=A0A7S4C5X9_CHRCT